MKVIIIFPRVFVFSYSVADIPCIKKCLELRSTLYSDGTHRIHVMISVFAVTETELEYQMRNRHDDENTDDGSFEEDEE